MCFEDIWIKKPEVRSSNKEIAILNSEGTAFDLNGQGKLFKLAGNKVENCKVSFYYK